MRPPLNAVALLGGAAITLVLLSVHALADSPPASAPAAGPTAINGTPPFRPATSERPPSPMLQEIQAVLEQERVAVEALRQRLNLERDGLEALRLQREVEQVKRQARWSVLEVQIRYAHAEGRSETARQLEAVLAAAKNPPAASPAQR